MPDETTLAAPPLGETAETAPVVEQPKPADAPAKGFHELSKTERRNFLDTGKIKGPKTEDDKPADSSPAPSGEQTDEIASKTSPASEPGKPEKKSGKGIDKRKAELQAEIEEMNQLLRTRSEVKRQLDALEKEPKQAGKGEAAAPDSTETAKERYKRLAKLTDAPRAETFNGDMDEYTAAMSEFVASKVAQEEFGKMFAERDTQSRAESDFHRAADAAISRAEARAKADKDADPTISERISESFKATPAARFLPPDQVQPHHIAKDLITFECEHPLKLGAFYSSDEGMAELKGLDVEGMRRAIYIKDASFGKPNSPQVTKPPSKKFTNAPDPSSKVEARPAGVVDPLAAEKPPGRFRDFMRLMDEQEGVQSRYRR